MEKSLILFNKQEIGKGVRANRKYAAGEHILVFSGPLLDRDELPEIITPEDDRYMQIGIRTFIGSSRRVDDFVNHSCDPNSGAKFHDNRVELVALRDIEAGEEVTWDYSTTMFEDDWEIECLCGAYNCRGRIREFRYLPDDIKRKYISFGIVPEYNM